MVPTSNTRRQLRKHQLLWEGQGNTTPLCHGSFRIEWGIDMRVFLIGIHPWVGKGKEKKESEIKKNIISA